MLPGSDVVLLSRWQFGLTALYHFLFVPLTLGLSIILAIMESVYVMTKNAIYRDMTKFWGVLFGINFAMGVSTGLTMEFQFGTNWAYYSQYVGDIFGAPLAIEGLMAFFLEATLVGLFFFGWNKLSKLQHLSVTWFLGIATNFSALWILIANGWMQHPVGSEFNFYTMRMELTNFYDVLFNTVAQAKFVHTISAGYVTGAVFVLSISAFYVLRGRNIEFAKRSMTIAASFGLIAAISVVILGDESGYLTTHTQKMKLAMMESEWHTEEAPASLTLFGIPNQKEHRTDYQIKIPYLLGLIATRSTDEKITGITELVEQAKPRIKNGIVAYSALQALQKNPKNTFAQRSLKRNIDDLGYGLLLKNHMSDIRKATKKDIDKVAWDIVPNVSSIFWSFRLMVGCGLLFIFLFTAGFYLASKRQITEKKWYLRLALYSLPFPWLAAELGWYVAEHGRQPWVIDHILPTFLGTSSLSAGQLWTSIAGFVIFYSGLAIIEFFLMLKYIRLGPDGLFQNLPHVTKDSK